MDIDKLLDKSYKIELRVKKRQERKKIKEDKWNKRRQKKQEKLKQKLGLKVETYKDEIKGNIELESTSTLQEDTNEKYIKDTNLTIDNSLLQDYNSKKQERLHTLQEQLYFIEDLGITYSSNAHCYLIKFTYNGDNYNERIDEILLDPEEDYLDTFVIYIKRRIGYKE